MSTNSEVVGCPAIDWLIESSKTLDNGELVDENSRLKWIPYSEFTNIETIKHPSEEIIYSAQHKSIVKDVMLLLLGTHDECTEEFIHEFARTHSIPTHKYKDASTTNRFRRYPRWLDKRNKLIKGFTKNGGNYYMVAERRFHCCYALYGFCSECGLLRCSPVWCICGHKELSDKWTSDNKKLDEFIRKSQRQTKSANEAYLEWLSSDYIRIGSIVPSNRRLWELPTNADVKCLPLEITAETDDSYYHKVKA